jgi:hypothetical protein
MLFSVTDANLKTTSNGGKVGKPDGTDILFTASDGITKLDYELESYNSATGQVVAWVRLPSLSPTTDTSIYAYYGNPSAPNQQNKIAVWDSNYKLVWHLANGNTLSGADSTSNQNNGMAAGAAGVGKIGGGAAGIVEDLSASLPNEDQTRTLECWFQMSGNGSSDQSLCGMGDGSGTGTSFSLVYRSAGSKLTLDVSGASQFFSWSFDTNWHHLAATYTSGSGLQSAVVYLDGVPKSTSGKRGTLSTPSTTYADVRHNPANPFDDMVGVADEFRISNTARPASWILTEYNNQNSPNTFYSVGAQQ